MFINRIPTAGGGTRRATGPFIITVKTDNPGNSNDNQFELGLNSNHDYNFTIDWGDGTTSDVVNSHDNQLHTYSSAGTYTITITGDTIALKYTASGSSQDDEKITSVEAWGGIQWLDGSYAFDGCKNCVFKGPVTPYTPGITSTKSMFDGCAELNQPVNFDTSSVTDMGYMFRECSKLNSAINLNTSNATIMYYMFLSCTVFNQPLNFDTGKVTTFSSMFYECSAFNQPLNFDTSSVTDMGDMFIRCTSFNQPLNFDTSKVNFLDHTFDGCTVFDQDLSGWNIGAVTTAASMLVNTALSTANYDKLLVAWEGQAHNDSVRLDSSAKYTAGSSAEQARTRLINDDSWTITDGGAV